MRGVAVLCEVVWYCAVRYGVVLGGVVFYKGLCVVLRGVVLCGVLQCCASVVWGVFVHAECYGVLQSVTVCQGGSDPPGESPEVGIQSANYTSLACCAG